MMDQSIKTKKLYTYTEDQLNAILGQLGELPAKNVLTSIQILRAPKKIEDEKQEIKNDKETIVS